MLHRSAPWWPATIIRMPCWGICRPAPPACPGRCAIFLREMWD